RHLVRAPDDRAIEPSLRPLDLYLPVLCARFRRAEAEWVLLSVLELPDRVQPKPGLRGRRAHGPGLPGADSPQPRPTGPDDYQNHPRIQAPAKISPARQAVGRMGSRGRETYV